MFDHVLLRVSDRSASEAFYSTVLAPLGVETFEPLEGITRFDNLGLTAADDDHPVTHAVSLVFAAGSTELVDAVWKAGEQWREGDVLCGPDGHVVGVTHDDRTDQTGIIHTLRLGVGDLPASSRFYSTLAPQTGFTPGVSSDERVDLEHDAGTLTLVVGDPTSGLHLAFAAPDRETVQAFHATAVEAGYESHGEPGERPVYADGYYGAFVFDPDGNNVESVHMG